MKKAFDLLSWGVIGVLLAFIIRRWLFIVSALLPTQPETGLAVKPATPSQVLLLVPLRNEADTLPDLLTTLDHLDNASQNLTVMLIDDGSTDGSPLLIQRWADNHENSQAILLEKNVGKAQALNIALSHTPQPEVVVIFDADERPTPTTLRYLLPPFCDPNVGGVSGRRAVSNALDSPASSYTTFEGLVHQFITMRAKDRLNLAPAILGANCAYRYTALIEVGGFKPGALLEDSDLTLKLARAGWRTHFEPRAVSYHAVPRTIAGYWQQHTRWARGFNDVAKEQAGDLLSDPDLPLALRVELFMFSLGYVDRVALLVGGMLSLLSKRLRTRLMPVIIFNLVTPLVQIVAALKLSQAPIALWPRIVWLPLFFGLDIAMATTGVWTTLMNLPQIWEERRVRK